jgi:hypothetical protein
VNRCILCLFVLISVSACRMVDRRAFQDVERASKAVQTAIDGQAGLPRYRELLSAYAAALLTVGSRVTRSQDRAVLAEYEAALKNLTDLQLVWAEKDARGEMLPIREEVPARIARDYELGVNTNEPPSIYADEAMGAIRQAALKHLRAASQALGSGLEALGHEQSRSEPKPPKALKPKV